MLDSKNSEMRVLDFSFDPNWVFIPMTRNYIESVLSVYSINRMCISKLIICFSELFENAYKYSCNNGIRTVIEKNDKKKEITLTVSNKLQNESANKLLEYIEELNNQEDPFNYYTAKMREIYYRKKDCRGLGLARIRFEGDTKFIARYFGEENGIGVIEIKLCFDVESA